MQCIEYLQQVILQNQRGLIINEQLKPPSLYNNKAEEDNHYTENYTTSKYEKVASRCKPIYFSTNLAELPTPHNEEPSRWLPKQDDSPLLETMNNSEEDNNFSEFLKKVNEALETSDEAYDEEKELFNKINEILKPDHRKMNKVDESYPCDKHSDFFLPCNNNTGRIRDFLHGYEKRAPFDNNHYRMNKHNDNISRINYMSITDDSIHENGLKFLIHKYTSSKSIPCDDMDEQTCTCRNNPAYESNTIANLEEQFTGASLEYWGNHSIDSVEHSLTQSEWNILKSPNESVNWLQHSFNQYNWLRNSTPSPDLRQRNLYA
ncbi:hypothetical protein C1645_820139 [Glomus cerebriforme]|uniref:Uncharacterized protein n=1 Tax=Glomus cerebriforme TaxID=658196 RepID=A0A397T3E7_9GLOM|nr:hypothetical protein C1645_820139 [Glomus cerebriforme]